MTDDQLIEHHGGPAKLAVKLGWTESRAIQRIHNWRSRGIPAAVKLAHPDLFLRSFAPPPTPEPAGVGEAA